MFITEHENQRDYFSFHNYEYALDVQCQKKILSTTINIYDGLKESYEWYLNHQGDVVKKDYIKFIDENFDNLMTSKST